MQTVNHERRGKCHFENCYQMIFGVETGPNIIQIVFLAEWAVKAGHSATGPPSPRRLTIGAESGSSRAGASADGTSSSH